MDRADVGMVERTGGTRFSKKASFRRLIADQMAGKKFDCYRASELEVRGAIENAHATGAELLFQPVVRQDAAHERIGRGTLLPNGGRLPRVLATLRGLYWCSRKRISEEGGLHEVLFLHVGRGERTPLVGEQVVSFAGWPPQFLPLFRPRPYRSSSSHRLP